MKASLFAIIIFLPIQSLAQSPCGEMRGPIPFTEHGKVGYVSDKGVVIPPSFDNAGVFNSETAIACVGAQCGFINKSGTFIAPTWERDERFLLEGHYSDGLAPAESNGHWGYVDKTRRVVIPFQFTFADEFENGMARVGLGDRYFFIDKTGTRITTEFDGVSGFHEGLAAVIVGRNVGYIRPDGSFALPAQYQSASGIDFSEGVVAVRVNGKVGFMDKYGNVVIEPKYDDVYAFSDGVAPVRVDKKWGYIDHEGNVVIPIKYEIGHMFSEGLASVKLDGKWGYIDNKGQFVISPTFDSAMPFCGGVASVETLSKRGDDCHGELREGKHGVINHTGNYVWRDAEEQTLHLPYCF